MKYYLVLAIAMVLSSCDDKIKKNKCLNHVEFIFTLRKSIPLIYVGGINYQKFSFYRNETLCLEDTTNMKITSLDIFFPNNYTSFSLNDSTKCKCIYTYKNFNNDFITDTVKTGVAEGILVDKDLWKVNIKIKEFNFQGIISSNEKYNGFCVNSTMSSDLKKPDGADMSP